MFVNGIDQMCGDCRETLQHRTSVAISPAPKPYFLQPKTHIQVFCCHSFIHSAAAAAAVVVVVAAAVVVVVFVPAAAAAAVVVVVIVVLLLLL